MYRTRNLPFFVSKSAWHSDVNALGSNIVLTDDDQNVIVRYEYDVFGAIRSEVGTSDNVRTFTGKEYDSDAKLHYFVRRYYDPYIGRFIMRDPAGQGVNWYLYTDNNPLTRIDRDGQLWETVFDVGGALYSGWQFIRNPGWGTFGTVAYDGFAALVPVLPGSWVARTGRLAVRVVSKADPKVFEGAKYTQNTAAKYLRELSGVSPKGHDAHHIIPKAVHDQLADMGSGINPNAPHLMTWWKSSKAGGTHQNFWKKYNDEWEEFLDAPGGRNRTDDEILEFAHKQAEKYKKHYWKKRYYFELYQEVPMGSGSPYGYRSRQD